VRAQVATRRRTSIGGLATPDHVSNERATIALRELYAGADDRYQAINHGWRVTWLRHRMREYVNIHGYASSGVCALLERAAEQYADSDYLRATAASKGDPDPTSLKQASQHAANARSHELAAWELAAREGVMRRQLGEQDEKVSKLARELNKETTSSEPMTWAGGLTGELVDAGAIEGLPSPFSPPGGVEGRGTLLPPEPLKTDSPPSPLPPVASPKFPLYLYCEPCGKQFRTRAETPHCTRCGTEAVVELEPVVLHSPYTASMANDLRCPQCRRYFRAKDKALCVHCLADPLPESGSPGIIAERESTE
jgi:hypothetical protein